MDQKICLITGVSSGVGESLTRLLAKDGWFVVGIARRTVMPGPVRTNMFKSNKLVPFVWESCRIYSKKGV